MPEALGSSFRDPAGFVYRHDGELYRQINASGSSDYEMLMSSGLYEALTSSDRLVAHEEVPQPGAAAGAWRTIKPETVAYVSYPYEWCFGQLKAAALLTLDIQRTALEHGMSLKDASAFNVQFRGCRPVFIDTLSFEPFEDGKPWVAYRQFCQHFLGPLLVMSYRDPRLRHIWKGMLDGLPLDLTSKLLPWRTRLRWSTLAHIHMHAASQQRHFDDTAGGGAPAGGRAMTSRMHLAMVDSLEGAVRATSLRKSRTEWAAYYDETNYSRESMSAKESLVVALAKKWLSDDPLVHDLGANTGRFSRLLAEEGFYVVAHDIDEMAVEANYQQGAESSELAVLPLVLDINNPSPALGWALDERASLTTRIAGRAVLALALIHHIAISNNVPMKIIAEFFAGIAARLVIEFVPKEDSQVQRLLATRDDIFSDYTIESFREAFGERFTILDEQEIEGTCRTLFALERRPL